jgi:DNA-binding transcriptional LysR family regulator
VKDLNLLYVFEALWRDRSVTIAAESLGVSQAAVSSSLKRLRGEYDDPVFTLVGRRMEPTPRAVGLSHQLLEALALVRKSRSGQARFDPATSRRMFTVRTRDIGEVVCFPRLLASMGIAAPEIRLRTVFKPIEETIAGLASGHIDLALGFLPSLETGIHRKLLFKQHYVCVMRVDHPIARRRLTLELFCSQDHLLTEYSGSGHQALERALNDAGLRNRIKVRLPQYLSAPHLIVESDLLWVVPSILAERLAKNFPLVIKPAPLTLGSFEIGLYWHDRFHRDVANKWLRDFIGEQFTDV